MSSYPLIHLKPGRDVSIRAGHPWIFSQAIEAEQVQDEPGIIVRVQTHDGADLGLGAWNPNTSIRVRMMTHDSEEPIDTGYFCRRFSALDRWKRNHLPDGTDGYRLVHAEVDGISGLIVDRYADVCVFQLHTAGIDRLRNQVIQALEQTFQPRAIVERSDIDVRRIEGLNDQPIKVHAGTIDAPIAFKEAGLTFLADVLHGQKTGFFLDQRDVRLQVGRLSQGRRVLNLFGYTGAFSVHALHGGANSVMTVDASRSALTLAQRQMDMNGFDPENAQRCQFLEANVLDFVRDNALPGGPYDLIVCDPPAFAKSDRHLSQATKTYTALNAHCLRRLDVGGILVTSSCSGRLTPDDFRSMLRIAAGQANRDVRIIAWLGQPNDHAERLAFSEGRYLKTAILEVTAVLSTK